MSQVALESKQHVVDALQEDIQAYQRRLEELTDEIGKYKVQLNEMKEKAREGMQMVPHSHPNLSLLSFDDLYSSNPGTPCSRPASARSRRSFSNLQSSSSVVMLLQETLDELRECRATLRQQEEQLVRYAFHHRQLNSIQDQENSGRIFHELNSPTNALYEKILKEKDETIAELASMLASQHAMQEQVHEFLKRHASLPSTPR